MQPARAKVGKACQRCRRQKLKCDVERPCTLCLRAGEICAEPEVDLWRNFSPRPAQQQVSERHAGAPAHRAKRARTTRVSPVQPSITVSATVPYDGQPQPPPPENDQNVGLDTSLGTNIDIEESSSTMAMVERAFADSLPTRVSGPGDTPEDVFHSTPSRSTIMPRTNLEAVTSILPPRRETRRGTHSSRRSTAAFNELMSLQVSQATSDLLINTYFDRIHWFTLLLKQDTFRSRAHATMNTQSHEDIDSQLAFLSTVLAVYAVSIQYLGDDRTALLQASGIQAQEYQDKLLDLLGQRLFAVMATGTLEAVQTCTLLGIYYLYHGEPDLAWPICGCGIRVAQALGLHRRSGSTDTTPTECDAEVRKRAWWAINELETFCCMLYGLPLSISETDCDVDYLDIIPRGGTQSPSEPNLLMYKYYTSKLSTIVKTTLVELYGRQTKLSITTSNGGTHSGRLMDIIAKLKHLEQMLQSWHDEVRSTFNLDQSLSLRHEELLEEVALAQVGASGPKFNQHIFRLQELALKLAYQNTRILIHRPLLSYQKASGLVPCRRRASSSPVLDQCRLSLQHCRDAALQISALQPLTIIQEASKTYAVTFVGMHLLTAGITLGTIAGLDPLSPDTYELKMGMRRIMQMQSKVLLGTAIADQGRRTLEQLLTLVTQRELDRLLDVTEQPGTVADSHSTSPLVSTDRYGVHDAASEGIETRQINVHSHSVLSRSDNHPEDSTTTAPSTMLRVSQGPSYDSAPEAVEGAPIPDQEWLDMQQTFDSDLLFAQLLQPEEQLFGDQEQGWIWSCDFAQQAV